MYGKIDPKKMQEMMKKLNMNVRHVDADEVLIKTKDKTIIISNPEVMIANMMGRDVYQITGDVSESTERKVNENDVELVMKQTGKDRETVVNKLEELDNDLARAILELNS